MNDDLHNLTKMIENNDKELFESAPCGFVFTDVSGLFIKCNDTFAKWTGFSKEELIRTKHFQDLLAVGSKIYFESHFRPLFHMQGHINEMTLDMQDSKGEIVPVIISSSEMKDSGGKTILIKSTIFNISERRKFEKDLIEARKKSERAAHRVNLLASAAEELRKSTNYKDHFHKVAEIGIEHFCDIMTIDLIEHNTPVRIASAQNTIARSAPLLDKELMTHAPLFLSTEEEIKQYYQFDSLEPESVIILPILKHNIIVGVVSFYMIQLGRRFSREDLDLASVLTMRMLEAIESASIHAKTEKIQRELEESHEWFSTTLNSIGDAVLAINIDKTINFLNPMAEELTGWKLEDARGKSMDEVFKIVHSKTREKAFNPVDKVLTEKKIVGLLNNTSLLRRDGSEIIIEDSAAPIIDSKGKLKGVVLVFRDTSRKYEEEAVRSKLLDDLQSEREVREKFVATLTHDLRSPLTGIKLNLQILLKKSDQPQKVIELSQKALRGVGRVDRMIQDLLDANRIRAGESISMEKSEIDMASLARHVLVDLALIHGDRFSIDAPETLAGYWNYEGIRRIIENLCNNAIKYGYLDTPVEVQLKQEKNDVVISVHNEGNPIPEDEIGTLFNPYRRAKDAEVGKQKGWGLGLTLVKGVTLAHGGQVNVRSGEKTGTTFEIRLPVDSRL